MEIYRRGVGIPRRRLRLAIAVVAIAGLGRVVSLAVASRADTPARIDVAAAPSADQTSTNAANTTDRTSTSDTTTGSGAQIETTTSRSGRTNSGPLLHGFFLESSISRSSRAGVRSLIIASWDVQYTRRNELAFS